MLMGALPGLKLAMGAPDRLIPQLGTQPGKPSHKTILPQPILAAHLGDPGGVGHVGIWTEAFRRARHHLGYRAHRATLGADHHRGGHRAAFPGIDQGQRPVGIALPEGAEVGIGLLRSMLIAVQFPVQSLHGPHQFVPAEPAQLAASNHLEGRILPVDHALHPVGDPPGGRIGHPERPGAGRGS